MKSLKTIQGTFKVFKVLSKIAMIFSFVAAGLTLIGAACGMVWYNGGTVVGVEMETLMSLTETSDFREMIGSMLTDVVFELSDGVLWLFAFLYFKAEQADGTPFTQSGAVKIRRLGILNIVLPLVAAIVSVTIYSCYGLNNPSDWSNAGYISLGVMLILASLVFCYGAELEERNQA